MTGSLAVQSFDILHEYALYLGVVVHETDGTGQIDMPPVRRDRP
jgi:hypothetical protein